MGILKSYFTEAAGIEVVVVMESMSRSQFGNDLTKAESFVKKQTPWHFISHGNSFLLFMIVLCVFLCILQLSVSAIDHEFDVSEESHPA